MNEAKAELHKKLRSFLKRPGMFVNPVTAETVVSFVNGMAYSSEFDFGSAFTKWLSEKYSGISNPFSWNGFISHLRFLGEIESETELDAINAELDAYISELFPEF